MVGNIAARFYLKARATCRRAVLSLQFWRGQDPGAPSERLSSAGTQGTGPLGTEAAAPPLTGAWAFLTGHLPLRTFAEATVHVSRCDTLHSRGGALTKLRTEVSRHLASWLEATVRAAAPALERGDQVAAGPSGTLAEGPSEGLQARGNLLDQSLTRPLLGPRTDSEGALEDSRRSAHSLGDRSPAGSAPATISVPLGACCQEDGANQREPCGKVLDGRLSMAVQLQRSGSSCEPQHAAVQSSGQDSNAAPQCLVPHGLGHVPAGAAVPADCHHLQQERIPDGSCGSAGTKAADMACTSNVAADVGEAEPDSFQTLQRGSVDGGPTREQDACDHLPSWLVVSENGSEFCFEEGTGGSRDRASHEMDSVAQQLVPSGYLGDHASIVDRLHHVARMALLESERQAKGEPASP